MSSPDDGYGSLYNLMVDCTCPCLFWIKYVKVSRYYTDISVLKSYILSDKLVHDREMKGVKEALRSIAAKLDSIEQALREK